MKENSRKVGEKNQPRTYVEDLLKLKYQMEVRVELRIGTQISTCRKPYKGNMTVERRQNVVQTQK